MPDPTAKQRAIFEMVQREALACGVAVDEIEMPSDRTPAIRFRLLHGSCRNDRFAIGPVYGLVQREFSQSYDKVLSACEKKITRLAKRL